VSTLVTTTRRDGHHLHHDSVAVFLGWQYLVLYARKPNLPRTWWEVGSWNFARQLGTKAEARNFIGGDGWWRVLVDEIVPRTAATDYPDGFNLERP
jgi:hypothetical protein